MASRSDDPTRIGARMKISVFGLGYVGTVSMACLARDGHDLIGVDIDSQKVDLINAGKTPVVEEGMVELMERVVRSNRARATRMREEEDDRFDRRMRLPTTGLAVFPS